MPLSCYCRRLLHVHDKPYLYQSTCSRQRGMDLQDTSQCINMSSLYYCCVIFKSLIQDVHDTSMERYQRWSLSDVYSMRMMESVYSINTKDDDSWCVWKSSSSTRKRKSLQYNHGKDAAGNDTHRKYNRRDKPETKESTAYAFAWIIRIVKNSDCLSCIW